MNEKRIQNFRELMTQHEIDVVALVPGANLFYLMGLHLHVSERVVVALFTASGQIYLLLPAFEVPRVEAYLRAPIKLYPWSDVEGPASVWERLGRDVNLSGKRIAVEFLGMRVREFTDLQAIAPKSTFVDASALFARLRVIKDENEIAAMRRAARVIEASLQEVLQLVKPGLTEKELATQWQWSMRRCGADAIPAEPIVAAGPNSAQPHARATDRKIGRGEFVIFDGACQSDGYFTSITRTVAVGEIARDLQQIYSAVEHANEMGRKSVAPGVRCEEVDRAVRSVIAKSGYGNFFVHRTGYGLGLEMHEPPYIVAGNSDALAEGMTFTIQPGIYIVGQGGVHIEDAVLVTQGGCECLMNFTRELLVL